MNVAGVLIALSIFTAVFSCYCATRNENETQNSESNWRKQSEHPHLHFVDQKQLDELSQSKQHPILFRLQGFNADICRGDTSPKHMGITFEEFEKCLPWIPYGDRILISSSAGFDQLLLRRLRHLRTQRDLFLVSEDSGSGERTQRREA